MRTTSEDQKFYDPILVKGVKFGVLVQGGIGATYALDRDAGFLCFLTLITAGQNIQMPAPEVGLAFLITNTSASALTATIKQNDGTTTAGTIAQNAAAIVYSDGVKWYVGPLT
jgi:hypothetical protein